MRTIIVFLSFAFAHISTAVAQGFFETEYVSPSDMNDKQGGNHGSGDMFRLKGRYTLPLSKRMNERRQPTAWSMTLQASYATMSNKGEALSVNPREIINASLNVSHTRPLSERWQLMASLGAGIYSDPSEIAWRSVLANGAAIFAYRLSDNLSAGVGLGLTNSYGVPMVMPMGYLDWRTNGDIKVKVNMTGSMSVKASTMFGERLGLELTVFDIDGMSAVRRIDGTTKIYSVMMLRSSLSPTLHVTKRTKLYLGIGGIWLRSTKLSNRSLKGFFKSFSDDEGKYHFRPAMKLNIGISHKL